MLERENTLLVIIDVQGNLAQVMHEREQLFEGLQKMIKGAKILNLPIIWLEQIPENLGPTRPEIASLLDGFSPISKFTFSACDTKAFMTAFKAANCSQILLTGIEAHICVYQTAMDLLAAGNDVNVISDAVSSRTLANKEIGLKKIKAAGGKITSVETALFEILKNAKAPEFRDMIKIVK